MKKYITIIVLLISNLIFSQEEPITLLFKVNTKLIGSSATRDYSINVSSIRNPTNILGEVGGRIGMPGRNNLKTREQFHILKIPRNKFPVIIGFISSEEITGIPPHNGISYVNPTICSSYASYTTKLDLENSFYKSNSTVINSCEYYTDPGLSDECSRIPEVYIFTPTESVLNYGNCEFIRIPQHYFFEKPLTPNTPGLSNKLEYSVFENGTWTQWKEFTPTIYNPYNNQGWHFKLSDLGLGDFTGHFKYRVKIINTVYDESLTGVISADYIYTDPIITEIKSCSPKVLSQTPEANKCYGESLGKVVFKFDRPLAQGETMNLSYTKPTGSTGSSGGIVLNASNEYVLEGLLNGNYTNVTFQLVNAAGVSIGTPTIGQPFTITSPEALSFTTTAIQPVSCYDGNNGQFMLTRGGGTGKYKIGIECNNAQGCNIEEYNEIIVEENKGEPIRDEKAIFVKQFTVYPNPVSTSDHELQVEVELAFEQPLTLSLYRIETGALINQIEKPASKKHKERIDFNYASGTYYIIMKTKGAVQAKKVIKK